MSKERRSLNIFRMYPFYWGNIWTANICHPLFDAFCITPCFHTTLKKKFSGSFWPRKFSGRAQVDLNTLLITECKLLKTLPPVIKYHSSLFWKVTEIWSLMLCVNFWPRLYVHFCPHHHEPLSIDIIEGWVLGK